MFKSSRSFRNIEFVFLLILSAMAIGLFGILISIFIDASAQNTHLEGEKYANEWVGVAFIVLLAAIVYIGVFLIWQFALWRSYLKESLHKYVQLGFIFALGIFPGINMLLDYLLRNAFGIEKPFTEEISKLFLFIIIFPFTGGQ